MSEESIQDASAIINSVKFDESERDEACEGFIGDREEMSAFGFISLMVSNYLKSLEYHSAYAVYTLRDIRSSASRISPSFCKYFDKLRTHAETPTNGSVVSFVMVTEYIKQKEFNELIDLFIQDVQKQIKTTTFVIYDSVKFLASMLDLNETETLILQFYTLLGGSIDYELSHIISEMQTHNESLPSFFSKTFHLPIDEIEKLVSAEVGLFTSGLLEPHQRYKNHFRVISRVQDLLGPTAILNDEILENRLFPNLLDTQLDISDYHQTDDIQIMVNVINKGIEGKQKGINILLWGLPGTGKTELPLLLAKRQGWNLKIVGDIGKTDASEKARNERLLALNVAQRLFQNPNKKVVLLFDEMEDLFKFDQNAQHSKAFINRIIEKTPVPIVWTTNSMHALGAAVLRRMTFNIPFHKVPPASARKNIWKKYLTIYNREMSEEKLDDLASKYDVVPALIANTVRVADLSDLNEIEVDRVLKNLDMAMNLGIERKFPEPAETNNKFKIEFTNTNYDLNRITTRILETGRRNFNILSYGPSGTGKSAFGIYLAEKMGMKYQIKKASDLLSMWLGETEKNIAAMFEDAMDKEQFLILDEADSFFQNRASSTHSWEKTQVNEMLVQMEKHKLPFVCTTNIEETIDPAAFRRFTFKIRYDYLTDVQRENIYEHYFGRKAPEKALVNLEQLAPGDFANIFSKMDFLGELNDEEILGMLKDECEIKPSFKRKIGF